jgi:hypothetical protein
VGGFVLKQSKCLILGIYVKYVKISLLSMKTMWYSFPDAVACTLKMLEHVITQFNWFTIVLTFSGKQGRLIIFGTNNLIGVVQFLSQTLFYLKASVRV